MLRHKEKEVVELRKLGKPLREIAAATGLTYLTCRYICAKHGVTLTSEQLRKNSHQIYSNEIKEQVVALRKQGLARKTIAERLNLTPETVKTMLAAAKVKLPLPDLKDRFLKFAEKHGYKVLGNYVDTQTKIEVECPNQHRYFTTPNSFEQKHFCRTCHNFTKIDKPKPGNAKYTWKNVLAACERSYATFLNPPPDLDSFIYKSNNAGNIWHFKCKCGKVFYPNLCVFIYGKHFSCGCAKISRQELEVYDLLTGWGYEVQQRNRTLIKGSYRGLELDMYLPAQGLAVEYCGIWFHSELCTKYRARLRHMEKFRECQKVGVRLITLFSDEWETRNPQVVGYLSAILGRNKFRIGARKCEIKEVDGPTAVEFVSRNHIQEGVHGTHFGLYHGNVLLSLITLRTPGSKGDDYKSGEILEISRFCNQIGVTVSGGFSRLVGHLSTVYPALKCLVTYSDNRWSEGNLYKAAGFMMAGSTEPSYWYFRKGSSGPREHKSKFRKANLKKTFGLADIDLRRTEWDLMQDLGYNRIWDCGTTKWVKTL